MAIRTSCSLLIAATEATAAGAMPGMPSKYTTNNSHAEWCSRGGVAGGFMEAQYKFVRLLRKL